MGVFLLYLLTLAPTVTFWDSGELIAASAGLGISHQPGYPLFAITGKGFSLIPFGSLAYRVNLLSAFFSALSVLVVYHALLTLLKGQSGIIALLFSLLLASVRVFWSQAVVTEVYALNSFFTAFLILIYTRARPGGLSPAKYFMLSGLMFGLGVVNHESFILYLPGLLLTWAVLPVEGGGRARFKLAAAALGFVALGLSVYIYLPVRSLCGPELNIGHPDDWRRFWWTVKWGEYMRGARGFLAAGLAALKGVRLSGPGALIGAPAGAYFAWRLLRRDWRLYAPLILFLAVYAMGISTQALGSPRDIQFGLAAKFYIPVFMMLVVLIGASAGDIIGPHGGERLKRALAVVLAVFVAVLVTTNFRPNDYGRHYLAYDYAENSLKSAGEGGVLFTWGDNGVFPLWYLQQAERYRDDVALIHTPLMTYDWYLKDVDRKLKRDVGYMYPYYLGENVYRIIKEVSPARTTAFDFSSTRFLKLDMGRLKARGLVYFEGPVPPGDPWPSYVFRGVDDPGVFKGAMEKNIIAIYNYQRKIAGRRN